ncbi:MAG TPA: hypothetical protein VH681_01275 [Nitrospiraceae bacterium]|jgi:hypothetical protein
MRISERLRLETLIARVGHEHARQWAKKTLELYRSSVSGASHYASQPDWRPLFEQSIEELWHFAETGTIP